MIAKLRESVKLRVIVKTEISKQCPDNRSILLFDAVVVIAFTGSGARDTHIRVEGLEVIEEVVVDKLRAVVKADNRWTERKLLEDVVNGSTDGLRASVPDRRRSAPSERPTPMRENTV